MIILNGVHEQFTDEICRICLNKTKCIDFHQLKYNEQKFTDLFYNYTKIKLPNKSNEEYLCFACYGEFLQTIRFIEKCCISHEKIQKLLANSKIKCKSKEVHVQEKFMDNGGATNKRESTEFLQEIDHCVPKTPIDVIEGMYIKVEDTQIVEENFNNLKVTEKEPKKIIDNEDIMEIDNDENAREQSPTVTIPIIFACDVCPQRFHDIRKLNEHTQVHTNKSLCTFDVCEKGINLGASLHNHVLDHSEETLSYGSTCDKEFSQKSIQQDDNLVHSKQHFFVCECCMKSFRTKAQLNFHHKVKCLKLPPKQTEEKSSLLSLQACKRKLKPKEGAKVPLICKLCKTSVWTLSSLQEHVHKVHSCHDLACNVCGKKFRGKRSLLVHERTHSENAQFLCKICNNKFIYAYQLKNHMYWHTCEKSYACSLCPKTFSTNAELKYHIQFHFKKKKYIYLQSL